MFGRKNKDEAKSKPCFLIVDDDPLVVELLEASLNKLCECDLEVAKDGHRGLYWSDKKAFDLITLDIKMGQVNGDVVYKHIRETTKNQTTPILIISGYVDRDINELVEGDELTSLIHKPFPTASLYKEIRQYLPQIG